MKLNYHGIGCLEFQESFMVERERERVMKENGFCFIQGMMIKLHGHRWTRWTRFERLHNLRCIA